MMAEFDEPVSVRKQHLRVAFVLPSDELSGGVRTTIEMANRMAAAGEEASVVILQAQASRPLRSFIKKSRSLRDSVRVPMLQGKRIAEDLAAGYDVIVGVGTFTSEFVSTLRTSAKKARWCKGFSEHRPEEMCRVWRQRIPTAVVSSPLEKKFEEISGVKAWGVVPNGIDLSQYYPTGVRRDGVGTIFNPNPKKAPADVLAICRMCSERYPAVPVRVYGACRRPRGLRCSEYTEAATLAETRGIYSASKVWFIASRSEGFCNPIVEAMACGAAIVVTRHDSAPGLVADGETGLMVDVGDVNGVTRAIGVLLEDDALRQRLVDASRDVVEKFSWDSAVRCMRSFLSDVSGGWEPGEAG